MLCCPMQIGLDLATVGDAIQLRTSGSKVGYPGFLALAQAVPPARPHLAPEDESGEEAHATSAVGNSESDDERADGGRELEATVDVTTSEALDRLQVDIDVLAFGKHTCLTCLTTMAAKAYVCLSG